MSNNKGLKQNLQKVRWTLVIYDLIIYAVICLILLVFFVGSDALSPGYMLIQAVMGLVLIFAARFLMGVYRQIWRYGGIQSYIKLILADAIAYIVYYLLQLVLPLARISFVRSFSLFCADLLIVLTIRMVYRYAYKCANNKTFTGRVLSRMLSIFSFGKVKANGFASAKKIKIAIVGAGSVGISLAEDLISNQNSSYAPVLFVDTDKSKIGREILNLPVVSEGSFGNDMANNFGIQEIVFAIPTATPEMRRALYGRYSKLGCKIKVFDNPTMENAGSGEVHLKEFDIEELLFRKSIKVADSKTGAFYAGKTVMITGGGGSIGSELCRQIAAMQPKRLVIVDVYENGAYEIQQELRILYKGAVDTRIEIVSVCDIVGLERAFNEHRPQIVLHAAAHKHVPLMEKNCIEAVKNNVFGTLNTVRLSIKYGVERFIMISTDKAVNPTNLMGATKRLCEMIVQAYAADDEKRGTTTFSATRFGNVLGSAGSVIPLFKKQIRYGGPVTITDKRIVRYFMTIPEASQLVLQSGAMAKNGELFVLDMGKPVKILDLAENMIKLSGMKPYVDIQIEETGLRPGEKLYEELLVKTEEMDSTENELIFIERDHAQALSQIQESLDRLSAAIDENDDEKIKELMKQIVPTYKAQQAAAPDEKSGGCREENQ